MGHGTPDWWGSEPTETVFRVTDMAELAARLGSIDTFDRRGNVIWLTGFENGLAEVLPIPTGTGAAVVISTATANKGAYSCKLTAGSDDALLAQIYKTLPYPALSKFGLEVAFTWDTTIDYLEIRSNLFDGTNRIIFAVKLDPSLGKAQYMGSDGAWHDIDTLPAWTTATYLFHEAKLVVDFETGKYYYLILDNVGYSLSAYSGYVVASATQPRFDAVVSNYGPGGTNPSIYIDDFIITQNEP